MHEDGAYNISLQIEANALNEIMRLKSKIQIIRVIDDVNLGESFTGG